ncbi:ABC transporter B family member 26, chloroplastic-like isoform X2 [Vigna umbellata]|uniref:ABC transporter B family member 26, chloroplastic-like isoform X2 n=1 Tax=Vigna umbellata TaxID=87088 RepID=UPI001F5E88CD|nr:ABC transporter B family member 26, chloroplastic-like isoform X2 [Vigna umbellata]
MGRVCGGWVSCNCCSFRDLHTKYIGSINIFSTECGLRSGCFGILNVTLVKHLRENLYATILFQDISYFDKERVGDLTSRLTADCQRLSHVIGNDLQLILRNTCQGTGAILNLMVLSWPLALSALVICCILSAIFIVYAQ